MINGLIYHSLEFLFSLGMAYHRTAHWGVVSESVSANAWTKLRFPRIGRRY